MVLGVRDDMVLGAADTLATAQLVGGEATEDDKTWSAWMATPFLLLGTFSILTRIF